MTRNLLSYWKEAMKIIGNYNFWNYDVTVDAKKVGVAVSGGADSALVLYLVALQGVEVYPYHIRIEKFKATPGQAEGVVAKVRELLPNADIKDLSYFDTTDLNNFIPNYEMASILQEKYGINLFIMGTTTAPQDESFTGGECPSDPARNSVGRPLFTNPNPDGKIYYHPFVNFDKKALAKLYEEFELMDTLFPITNSCVMNILNIGDKPCGKCWWCNEREWAFSSSDTEAGS